MTALKGAVDQILSAQVKTDRPLAIILAGHNGSGKSTMWRKILAQKLQLPLLNADRMMLSILPEAQSDGALVDWARELRDTSLGWMQVAQNGVKAFAAHAMAAKVPFATETVFSHWDERPDGTVASKLDTITDLQAAGYFVILFFVGLSNADLSILRVSQRVLEHGHDVDTGKLISRFPRTQKAISHALGVADASILTDNSRDEKRAFTVCRVQLGGEALYDVRDNEEKAPLAITEWLDIVSPPA
ncbi:zeta toxin family protein [Sphingobium sp. CFD-1]|uniref:zeta toxin family protein n=1 Tax=Sphingobium sp. CFD-1 TaxID=2878545 RepID=UPI00214BB3FF|nr:zeta toxin family protein [Sphingobium sp. CFD-1]